MTKLNTCTKLECRWFISGFCFSPEIVTYGKLNECLSFKPKYD